MPRGRRSRALPFTKSNKGFLEHWPGFQIGLDALPLAAFGEGLLCLGKRIRSAVATDSLLLWIRQEAVSNPAHRQQVARFSGIIFDVAAQSHHEVVDGARVGVFVWTPDFFENLLAGNNAAIVANQMTKQFRLHQRQVNDIATGTQLQRSEIDGLAAERECPEIADVARIGCWLRGIRAHARFSLRMRSTHPLAAPQ